MARAGGEHGRWISQFNLARLLFLMRIDEITFKNWTFRQSEPVGQHNGNPLPRRVVSKRLAVVHFPGLNRDGSRPARVGESS